jgi:hypothetical protein
VSCVLYCEYRNKLCLISHNRVFLNAILSLSLNFLVHPQMKGICKVGEIWKKNQHPRYISQNLKARAKKNT